TTGSTSSGIATSPLINANGSQGTVSVTATTGAFSTTFTLFIGLPPPLSVDPTVLFFQWENGTPLPKALRVTVTAPNNTFTFGVDVPWAKANAAPHGTINDGVTVTVDPSNLPPGHYTGNLILSDGAAVVRIDLQVLPKPQINPSAKKLEFVYTI